MGAIKAITLILGTKEFALRFIPLLSGIISVLLFYKISLKLFQSRCSLLVTNFLFCFNLKLIYYAQEFKQYSTDVLIAVLLLYLAHNIDITNMSLKNLITLSIIFALLPLLSLPSFLIIISFIASFLIKNKAKHIKRVLFLLLPMTGLSLLYAVTILLPSKINQLALYESYWEAGFIKMSFAHIINLIKVNIDWLFLPNNSYIMIFITMFIGLIHCIKSKTYFFPIIIISAIIAASIGMYPIYQRISLWLTPTIIIFIGYFTEIFTVTNKGFLFTLLVLGVCFWSYNPGEYLKEYNNLYNNSYNARSAMEYLSKIYTPNDYVMINTASDSEYLYYSDYFKFETQNLGVINLPEYNKFLYFNILNNLPKNRKYIFYYAYDYGHSPVIGYLKEWSKNNTKFLESDFINSTVIGVIK